MLRTLKVALLVLVLAAIAMIALRLRAQRAPRSELGMAGELPGSFDTWPDVPRKQVA